MLTCEKTDMIKIDQQHVTVTKAFTDMKTVLLMYSVWFISNGRTQLYCHSYFQIVGTLHKANAQYDSYFQKRTLSQGQFTVFPNGGHFAQV